MVVALLSLVDIERALFTMDAVTFAPELLMAWTKPLR
jgi:hypothetical protein